MTQRITTLMILGASGDLSSRLLLPALGQLLTLQPDRRLELIGSGAEDWTDDQWRKVVRSSFETVDAAGAAVSHLVKSTRYHRADVTKGEDLTDLLGLCEGAPALYFALPPAVTAAACAALSTLDLPDGIQLALEKPFGRDEESAHQLNELLAGFVAEDQIHRIDHFLGQSTVLNLLGLRFANRIFEPLWSAEHIEKVDIVYDEQLGLENRARYYDKAGALVDMIQSHLLQVLAVLAMEPPSTLSAADLRDAKGIVLRATRVRNDDARTASRRARYTAGTAGGERMPSYADEAGVDPALQTETLAELTLEVDTWRWSGVPFTLRSGKALGERRREIVVTFKGAQRVPEGLTGTTEPTVLRLLLAPDAMSLELNINGPGDPKEIGRGVLQAEFGPGQLLAYAEVLEALFDGDPSLSVRGDAAEECWRIVGPVLAAWKADEVVLDEYPAGSAGPASWAPIG